MGRVLFSPTDDMPRRPANLRDWLFGSECKRLLLAAITHEPTRTWSRASLARACGVHEKGGVRRHVEMLVRLGVLESEPDGVRLNRASDLARPVQELVDALERLELP